ncbi:MAG: hypothetical protein GQ574_04485 [Crocinitomix sp.]|nr:hypothetical protein [Crocinitomix sp.]
MLRLILGIGFVFCLMGATFAQDTIRVMYYNLLNFPDDSPERIEDLRQIMGYAQPDILVVCELQSSEGADLILNEALNVWGEDKFEAAEYVDGPYTDNMLFYNSDLLGFIGQEEIPTDLRDINEYQLYYKNPGLGASSDTIYLNLYGVHLKAGSGFFNRRKEQAIVLKYYLNTLSNAENIFVGGDFNFYSGNESGCLAIRETGDVDLFDPISSIGDWNNNGAYANIHTQSTRTAPLADGAGGGMDDRFDLIFTTADVLDNTNGINMIEGSYQALGQDGDRFNSAINSPYNPSVPDSVSSALYFMSDHLPVLLDLKTDYTADISSHVKPNVEWFYNATTNELVFNQPIQNAQFELYDLSGKLILQQTIEIAQTIEIPSHLNNGLFCWNLLEDHAVLKGKLVKK